MRLPAAVQLFDPRNQDRSGNWNGATRQALAEHRFALVDPLSSLDLVSVCWWALKVDPFSTMVTLRGPAILFAGHLWRRSLIIQPTSLTRAADRLRFEAKARALPPTPERLLRWYSAVRTRQLRQPAVPPPHLLAAELPQASVSIGGHPKRCASLSNLWHELSSRRAWQRPIS